MENCVVQRDKDGNIEYKKYYIDGHLHRDNEPALIGYYPNGHIQCEMYFQNDKIHRLDGPAYIGYNNDGNIDHKEYWINNIKYDDILKYLVIAESLKGE